MTLASIFLGTLIATIPACLLLFLAGGGLRKLIVLIASSWIGFWLGHLFALWRGWSFLKLGAINLGTALIFCILFAILGFWLSNFQPEKKRN
jgi:hypothetical protein